MHEFFISCDWGTSSFRIKLIRTSTLEIINAIDDSNLGFGKQSLSADAYLELFVKHAKSLCTKAGIEMSPISMISGMASSSIGIKNLPYGKLPLRLNDFHFPYEVLSNTFSEIYLISGLSTEEDVMRGEEVQLLGSIQKLVDPNKDYLIILPGTHSKHLIIAQQMLRTFKTYLTGELFSLLQNYSILKHSVKKEKIDMQNAAHLQAFKQGLQKSSASLLHEFFSIRARQILQHTDPVENYAFLSGLLIGSELSDIKNIVSENIILCADQPIADLYHQAIELLYPDKNINLVSTEEATILGHYKLLQQIHTS